MPDEADSKNLLGPGRDEWLPGERLLPEEPVFELLRAGDETLARMVDETLEYLKAEGFDPLNLLNYLDLPFYQQLVEDGAEEREQELFLLSLYTWANFCHFGRKVWRLSERTTELLLNPRPLFIPATLFKASPPSFCLQLPRQQFAVRGAQAMPVKEVYVTYYCPPNPDEDPELKLLVIAMSASGEIGFIPLEMPVNGPTVYESIEGFLAPGIARRHSQQMAEDLRSIMIIACNACLLLGREKSDRFRLTAPEALDTMPGGEEENE